MDIIDKKIFLSNFKEELDGKWVIDELTLVLLQIKKEGIGNCKKPSAHKSQIQRIKQVAWLLEANYKEEYSWYVYMVNQLTY